MFLYWSWIESDFESQLLLSVFAQTLTWCVKPYLKAEHMILADLFPAKSQVSIYGF